MQGGLSGNIWGGCLGWNPIDLGTVGAFIGVLGGTFGVGVGMEPHRLGGGTFIGSEWEHLRSVFGMEPHRLGGTFIGSEWEHLRSVFGMEPHRLGGGGGGHS